MKKTGINENVPRRKPIGLRMRKKNMCGQYDAHTARSNGRKKSVQMVSFDLNKAKI